MFHNSRRMTEVISRYGGASHKWHRPSAERICKYWLAGNCTRNPCRFLHPDKVAPVKSVMSSTNFKAKQSALKPIKVVGKRTNEQQSLSKVKNAVDNTEKPSVGKKDDVCSSVLKPSGTLSSGDPKNGQRKICEDWINQSCVYGDECKFLHSWCSGNHISKIAQLEGHQKAITGIILPSDSDKLFTSSKDGTVRIWNCHTGECMLVANMGAPVWCLASEGPWVFAGITNVIKAWNIKTETEFTLNAPGGHVRSLTMVDGALFGGLEGGSIFMWKLNSDATSFESHCLLKGHTGAVISLCWGAGRLYSSSMDKTIRVWDLENMVCINTLQKHSQVVTSLLCWDQFLLSSSFDKTLKVWGCTKANELDVQYTHVEEHGIVSLSGMDDSARNSTLMCSCSDNSVRLYHLPSKRAYFCKR
ncbi:hypothetical protein RND81_02G117600 [Saponaria officinalis]|uniref:C3H1-type domain-containing protein n=1 Tax=Saponaria officinalis TaxID=3572 RepID=A0AAW1MXN0_SAPOF